MIEKYFCFKQLRILTPLLLCLVFSRSQLLAQVPDWAWAKDAGDIKDEHAYSVATDGNGNSYVAGYFQSDSVVFGATTLYNVGYYTFDIMLVKYDPNGNVLWAKTAGGSESEKIQSVAVDATGNVYVAGWYQSPSITFGATTFTNTGSTDMFVAKYDANGNIIWAKSAWGTSHEYANGIAADPSGNVYVTGYYYSSSVDFGGASITNNGETDIFIVKYNPGGTVEWAKHEGGTHIDCAQSIATDNSGNIYMAGWFSSSSITIGGNTMYNMNCCSGEALIAKYDSDGNSIWAKSAQGDWGDQTDGVTTDDFGNSYVTGYFRSTTITFDAITLVNSGDVDVFIAKYDSNGDVAWAQSAGGAPEDQGHSVATDALGNIYATGWFASSTFTFGSVTLTNGTIGLHDIYLIKFDASGNALWGKSVGSDSHDQSMCVAADPMGNIWIGGGFASGDLVFDSTTLHNTPGDYDMLIAKIGSTESPSIASFGSSTTTVCEKFCIDYFDQSLNAASWFWNFEGGAPSASTDQNPAGICYDNPGTFDVTLIVTDINGVTDTLTVTDYVTVFTNPFAPVITQNGNVLTSSPATSYQWYLNGAAIPGATNQSYTVTQSGLYSVLISDVNGCQAQSDIDVTFSGIEDYDQGLLLTVYPNPALDEISIFTSGQGAHEIIVFTSQGRKISEVKIIPEHYQIILDLKDLPTGIYFIQVNVSSSMRVLKVEKS